MSPIFLLCTLYIPDIITSVLLFIITMSCIMKISLSMISANKFNLRKKNFKMIIISSTTVGVEPRLLLRSFAKCCYPWPQSINSSLRAFGHTSSYDSLTEALVVQHFYPRPSTPVLTSRSHYLSPS